MRTIFAEGLIKPIFRTKWGLFTTAAIIYGLMYFMVMPGFSHQAHMALAVFSVAAFLWMTNALPLAVVGIVVLFLLPVSGAVSAKAAYDYFGSSAVFFVLGAFILASPVMRSGLSTRIALVLISHFGRGAKSLLLSIFSLSAMLAFIISEHAVAVILFPIVTGIVEVAKCQHQDRFPFAAYLAMGWGAMIGGTATLLGGARAPLTIGILQSITDQTLSFSDWTYYVFPAVLGMLVIAFITILIAARHGKVDIEKAREQLALQRHSLGKLSQREILTVLVLTVTIFLWIFVGHRVGLELVAFFGVILAFMLKITNWREVEQDVQWGIIIMYGSAIALGAALRDTGAAHEIVQKILLLGIGSPVLVLIIMMVLAAFLTEAMSNAAAVAVLMPIGLALTAPLHMDPRAMALAIATAAGLTFLLPVSTPTMAIMTSSKFVPLSKALAWGLVPKILGLVVLIAIFLSYWPMVGLKI